MMSFLAQCPCSGSGSGGGGNSSMALLLLAGLMGLWFLAGWVKQTWMQKGISMRMKAVKIGTVLALALTIGVVMALQSGCRERSPAAPQSSAQQDAGQPSAAASSAAQPSAAPQSAVQPSAVQQQPVLSPAGRPRLVDYGAKSCIPCKKMAPILDELAREYAGRLEVEFVDVSLSENLARGNQASIRTIPTQVFHDASGQELWRHEGFMSKADILAKWKELGYDLAAQR